MQIHGDFMLLARGTHLFHIDACFLLAHAEKQDLTSFSAGCRE